MVLMLRWSELKMTTQDLVPRSLLSKEIWMVNLLTSLILLDRPKLKMLVTEISLLRFSKERIGYVQSMINLVLLEKKQTMFVSTTITFLIETMMLKVKSML